MLTVLEKALTKEYNQTVKIKTSFDIYQEMKDIKDTKKELFVVFHLDTKNQIIRREIVSIGILNASIVHPREVFRSAIISNVNSIIISHNHPSGDTVPSTEDITVTKTLVNAGDLLGIKVLDHVIVGAGGNYLSMNEKGFM